MNNKTHYTNTYKSTRPLSDIHLTKQKQILNDYLHLESKGLEIVEGTFEQDTKGCTDIIIRNPKTGKELMVGVRSRLFHSNYPDCYKDDMTIRCELITQSGRHQQTEIDKIATAPIKLIVYSIFSEAGNHIKTSIISVSEFLPELDKPIAKIPNNDGSSFNVYKLIDADGNNKAFVKAIILN